MKIEDLMEKAIKAMPNSKGRNEGYSFVYASRKSEKNEEPSSTGLPSTSLEQLQPQQDDSGFGLRAPLMLMGIPKMSSPSERRQVQRTKVNAEQSEWFEPGMSASSAIAPVAMPNMDDDKPQMARMIPHVNKNPMTLMSKPNPPAPKQQTIPLTPSKPSGTQTSIEDSKPKLAMSEGSESISESMNPEDRAGPSSIVEETKESLADLKKSIDEKITRCKPKEVSEVVPDLMPQCDLNRMSKPITDKLVSLKPSQLKKTVSDKLPTCEPMQCIPSRSALASKLKLGGQDKGKQVGETSSQSQGPQQGPPRSTASRANEQHQDDMLSVFESTRFWVLMIATFFATLRLLSFLYATPKNVPVSMAAVASAAVFSGFIFDTKMQNLGEDQTIGRISVFNLLNLLTLVTYHAFKRPRTQHIRFLKMALECATVSLSSYGFLQLWQH